MKLRQENNAITLSDCYAHAVMNVLSTSLQQIDVNVLLCVCICVARAVTHLEDLLSDGAIIGKPHSDTSTKPIYALHLEPPLPFLTLRSFLWCLSQHFSLPIMVTSIT
jgi:hypothetical protein